MMPGKKSKGRGSRRNRSSNNGKFDPANPGSEVIVYTGPFRVPRALSGRDLIVEDFTNTFGYTSSGTGTLTEVWNSDPTSAVDWSAAAGLYTLYRVLSFTLEFAPNVENSVLPSTNYAPLFTVIDNGNNTNLSGYAAAMSYDSCRTHTLNQKWRRVVKMDTTDLAEYVLIGGSPASFMQVKTFCTGLTASTTYGTITERYHVQFKARQ